MTDFVALLLGISNAAGNFGADEHALGRRILADNLNAEQRVFESATQFAARKKAREVPALIRRAVLSIWRSALAPKRHAGPILKFVG